MSFDAELRAAVLRCEQAAHEEVRVDAYYRAFRQIDRMIECVGALISQYALERPVHTVVPALALWTNDEAGEVRLAFANSPFLPEINNIIHVASDIPALQRLARVEGLHVEMNRHTGALVRLIVTSLESGKEATPVLAPAPQGHSFLRTLFREQ